MLVLEPFGKSYMQAKVSCCLCLAWGYLVVVTKLSIFSCYLSWTWRYVGKAMQLTKANCLQYLSGAAQQKRPRAPLGVRLPAGCRKAQQLNE